MQRYRAPWWVPGAIAHTFWRGLWARPPRGATPNYKRERWTTPDGDFLDLDWLVAPVRSDTLLVLFHGLEGSSHSHYAESFADFAAAQGIRYVVPHFRGCSGELNLAPRAYHSGDYVEVDWILKRLRERHAGPIVAVGVSLGGNALMRWAGEVQEDASRLVDAIASVCSPLDMIAAGHAIGRGFNRLVYTTMFLRVLKPKALRKWNDHPGIFDREAMVAVRDIYEFDKVFTAPVHGFNSTTDYWTQASALPHLERIRVPALAVNPRNDPFIPPQSLPKQREVGSYVTLWQPEHGGHCGFPGGSFPGHIFDLPDAVGPWLLANVSR
jgi:predicted alpha/beta-fold hydrolase